MTRLPLPGRIRSTLRLALACICLALAVPQAIAARVAVILSDDSAPYQEVYQAIRTHLGGSGHEVARLYAEGLQASALGETRLTVAVGVGAAETVAALPTRVPVLGVLVPRAWYLKHGRARLGDNGRRVASAIFLDQPLERQVALIRLAFPEVRRVGVVAGAEQAGVVDELDDALRGHRLGLVRATLAEDERLIPTLENVLAESDVLLALPDPAVFNRNTAQSIFLTSYRYRDPVVGYSRSMTRAGAMVSIYSSPAQIGRQAAEWVIGALHGAAVRLPASAHPGYFTISINEQVARSLGHDMPSEEELERRMGGAR